MCPTTSGAVRNIDSTDSMQHARGLRGERRVLPIPIKKTRKLFLYRYHVVIKIRSVFSIV